MGQNSDPSDLSRKILEQQCIILGENAKNAGRLHSGFLRTRQEGLEQTAMLIQMQAEASGGKQMTDVTPLDSLKPMLYTREQLEEFGTGDLVKCLGPEFTVYKGQRTPRIPNGDLLMMSRVLSASGKRSHPEAGDEIIVEYDVSEEAWYLQDNNYPFIPYSILMEIVLQPCGLLSAHLGTPLMFPEQDYYFRNLDGEARILNILDLRGKTVTAHASLHKTMVSGKQIIQKFDFQLSVAGEPIFVGNSVFGFFPPEAMANQIGRDGGQETVPLFEQTGRGSSASKSIVIANSTYYLPKIGRPYYHLPEGKLSLLREVFIDPEGGRNQKGYIYANKPIDPLDWFYTCHFFEDPVMPGSLGVEAILEAMQVFALQQDLGRELQNPRFDLVPDQTMDWKYRGQILQKTKMMKLEVHLTRIERFASEVRVMGEASLWADRIRIYELKNVGIRLVEG
jgi:3-hydroxymyristoyl/3-hydroxydecanoyl-(acyl carrier protein) dehydratase